MAVTGHSNGTIALWGLSYPSDVEQEKKLRSEANDNSVSDSGGSGDKLLPSTGISRSTESKISLRIDRGRHASVSGETGTSKDHTTDEFDDTTPIVKVIPTCHLYIMKLLLDHRSRVTALTLGSDQRQLLSGDADGNCIRWVDDSISTNIL